MTTDIRLHGCLSKEIMHIVNYIKYRKQLNNTLELEAEMNNQANIKARHLIEDYDVRYCKVIIKTHANNNIFNAIKRIIGPIDYSSEIKFYRQLVFSYVVDIVYNKIKNMHEIMMLPQVQLREQIECSICLCNIENTRVMSVTRCNHCFHRNCLVKWKETRMHPTCPNCRVSI